MAYTLWDTRSGNCIGEFEHEDDALSLVGEIAKDNGPDVADTLELFAIDDQGALQPLARGRALLERVSA